MPILFKVGYNRLIYKSSGFQTGLTVTALVFSPPPIKSSTKVLTEIGDGLYCLSFSFKTVGTWAIVFLENEVKTTFTTVRVSNVSVEVTYTCDHCGKVTTFTQRTGGEFSLPDA